MTEAEYFTQEYEEDGSLTAAFDELRAIVGDTLDTSDMRGFEEEIAVGDNDFTQLEQWGFLEERRVCLKRIAELEALVEQSLLESAALRIVRDDLEAQREADYQRLRKAIQPFVAGGSEYTEWSGIEHGIRTIGERMQSANQNAIRQVKRCKEINAELKRQIKRALKWRRQAAYYKLRELHCMGEANYTSVERVDDLEHQRDDLVETLRQIKLECDFHVSVSPARISQRAADVLSRLEGENEQGPGIEHGSS